MTKSENKMYTKMKKKIENIYIKNRIQNINKYYNRI